MKKFTVLLFLLTFSLHAQEVASAAPVSSAGDTARMLGGHPPVYDPALIALSREEAWQKHATTLHDWWNQRPWPHVQKVSAWASVELGADYSSTSPAIYFFSGADFLYLQALFPSASVYVMCAREPVGRIPDLTAIPPQNLLTALGKLQTSLQTLFNFSYFITEDMKTDLRSSELSGIAPILYVLLTRTGKTVINAQPVTLTSNGTLTAGNPADPQGIRIDFTAGNGAPVQTLYYFASDLSNSGLKANSGILKFCSRLGMGNGFVKSASYLMHLDEFSHVRDYLLGNCKVIVQDDSGIPIRYFPPETWNVRVFGNYVGPLKIFDKHYQKDLADRYAVSHPKPLEFGMGYRFLPHESAIMIAFRKGKSP